MEVKPLTSMRPKNRSKIALGYTIARSEKRGVSQMASILLPGLVFYPVDAVAAALAVSKDTVRRMIKEGSLSAVKIRGAIRIPETALTDYLATHKMEKPVEKPQPASKPKKAGRIKRYFA
jgi:excisionase family DNA binding protein